jgi:hypothetical protein
MSWRCYHHQQIRWRQSAGQSADHHRYGNRQPTGIERKIQSWCITSTQTILLWDLREGDVISDDVYYEKKDLTSHFHKGIIVLTCPQVENTSASFCSVTCRATRRKIEWHDKRIVIQSHCVQRAHMLINVRDINGPPHTILPISPSGSAPHPPPPLVEAVPSLLPGSHGQFSRHININNQQTHTQLSIAYHSVLEF